MAFWAQNSVTVIELPPPPPPQEDTSNIATAEPAKHRFVVVMRVSIVRGTGSVKRRSVFGGRRGGHCILVRQGEASPLDSPGPVKPICNSVVRRAVKPKHRLEFLSTLVRPAAVSLVMAFTLSVGSCRSNPESDLGPPDSYLVVEPVEAGKSAAGSFRRVPLEDPRAIPIHKAAADGFVGEVLRTDYLCKQLLRDGFGGKAFLPDARISAFEPTLLVLAGSRMTRPEESVLGTGVETAGFLGRQRKTPGAIWIEVGDDPVTDTAFSQTATGRIARLIAERMVSTYPNVAERQASTVRALVNGYALAMEVIAREWRVGEGPRGTLPPDAGTGTQRERFAGVRQNAFVFTPGAPNQLRSSDEMLAEPGVVAAVLYRMAQLKGIGRRVAPSEIYAPFVSNRVPEGVSPAAVLGPVRNFQAKLLTAWGRAVLAGKAPHDLLDLMAAYVDALPGEKNETIRIVVATTYGATTKSGGVSANPKDADQTLAQLTTLAAEVAAGRRPLRERARSENSGPPSPGTP